MNWKLIALASTLAFATVSETAQAQICRFPHRRSRITVIPSIQIGVSGPIITPGVRIGSGITVAPQIRTQPTFPPRTRFPQQPAVLPRPLNPYANPYPNYVAPVVPIRSERSLERSIENDIRARFGRAVDDVDVDVDLDDSEVEIEVEVDNRRFAPSIRAYVQSLRAGALAGFRRVKLDIDD